MNTGSHQLPLPAGARVSPQTRRTVAERWAAPDPATLILDPWAAPAGLAVASSALSPWPSPAPNMRIRWMASPAALHPAPGLFQPSPSTEAAVSTDRALATLRAITKDPVDAPQPAAVFAAPDASARVEASASSIWSQIRWRAVAVASAAGAAVGAGATLLITSL